jgi:hypothetical protein
MPNPAVNANTYGTAVPTSTSEYHVAGEVLTNPAPAYGSVQEWTCITSGRPGTWVPSATLPQAAIYNKTVTVSAAELAAIRATPKTLVAAPGAGYVLQFLGAQLMLDYTAPGFTETVDNFAVRFTDGSGAIVSEAIESTGFIDQTADTMTNAIPKKDAIVSKAAGENKALVLHNTGDGELAGGGGSAVRVNITYAVVPTGF